MNRSFGMSEVKKEENRQNDERNSNLNQTKSQKKVEKPKGKENKEFDEFKKKLKDLEDKLLRSLAENENIRKRHEKELEDNLKFANKNFAFALLNVTDNFQRALESISLDQMKDDQVVKNLVIGLEAVEKELYDIFEKNGITRFDSLKEKFNPEIHQAVSKINSDLVEGTIVEELQKGFMIGERLLRPSMVVISMGPKTNTKENIDPKKK